jgi:hypothetical protein
MTHGALWFLHLLATREESFRVWGRFDHQRPGVGPFELIILSAVALLLAGTLIWQIVARRRQREFASNNPTRLFGELCRAHRLDRSNRRLLKQLAAAHGIKSAALLFVEPDYFDMTNVPPALKSLAGELRQLRHKLFD